MFGWSPLRPEGDLMIFIGTCPPSVTPTLYADKGDRFGKETGTSRTGDISLGDGDCGCGKEDEEAVDFVDLRN